MDAAVTQGLRLIRVRRVIFAVFFASTIAWFWLAPATSGSLAYLVLGIGCIVTAVRYVGSSCPACQKKFFAPGSSIVPPWKIQALRSSCVNCGVTLDGSAS